MRYLPSRKGIGPNGAGSGRGVYSARDDQCRVTTQIRTAAAEAVHDWTGALASLSCTLPVGGG